MRKIHKLAKRIKSASEENYYAVKHVAELGKQMQLNSLNIQRAVLDSQADIYDQIDNEAKANKAKDLVSHIALLSSRFERDAFNYGLDYNSVLDYKSLLLDDVNNLVDLDSTKQTMKHLVQPFTDAVVNLKNEPIFKQKSQLGSAYKQKPQEEKRETYPLPPGLLDPPEPPKYRRDTLTKQQREAIEYVKERNR